MSYAINRVEILHRNEYELGRSTVISGDSTRTAVRLHTERLRGIYRHLALVSAASSTFYFSHADTIKLCSFICWIPETLSRCQTWPKCKSLQRTTNPLQSCQSGSPTETNHHQSHFIPSCVGNVNFCHSVWQDILSESFNEWDYVSVIIAFFYYWLMKTNHWFSHAIWWYGSQVSSLLPS